MLADEQVARRRQGPDRSAETTRVLEAVHERDESVTRSPEEHDGAADMVEVRSRVVFQERSARHADIRVLRRAFEESEDAFGCERRRIDGSPQSERKPTQPRPPGEGAAEPRHDLRWTNGACDGEPDLRAPRDRDDAGGRNEGEPRHASGPRDGQAEGDDAPHRVADEGRREHAFELGQFGDVVGVGGQVVGALEWLRPPVAWKIRDEHTMTPSQERREQSEVDSGAAEPVDDDERRALAADEVTGAHAADVCDSRLEPSEERCFRHVR